MQRNTAVVLDAVSGDPLADAPLEGQLLRASIANVTDADNPGGAITGPVLFVWQAEVAPGTGIFEDIVEEGGDKASTATGATFRVLDDLAGSAIRVKAVYQDANGVLETVFSTATAAVVDVVFEAPDPNPAESSTDSTGVHFIRSDLQFILDQIVISENHAAAGGSAQALIDLLPNSRMAFGLRTVDGSLNNLVPGQEHFGAADQNFPSLLDQVFRDEQDGETFDANGPAPGGDLSGLAGAWADRGSGGSAGAARVSGGRRLLQPVFDAQVWHLPETSRIARQQQGTTSEYDARGPEIERANPNPLSA